jgi:hypothetical protein
MDLEPPTYNAFMDHYGPDTSKWPHHISAPDSRPAEELGVRPGEYVIAKTAQDAFVSSNIANVLTNLRARKIVFVGGDTGACLGKSARSAISAGYEVLCVEDATFDTSQARRLEMFEQISGPWSPGRRSDRSRRRRAAVGVQTTAFRRVKESLQGGPPKDTCSFPFRSTEASPAAGPIGVAPRAQQTA